jgi:hypothetical protein
MLENTSNPATSGNVNRALNSSCVAADPLEHNQGHLSVQALRAAFVARKARLSPTFAAILAPIFFGLEAR